MDKMLKITMRFGSMTREANKDKEIGELKGEVQKLKEELTEKESQLQTRVLPPPVDAPPAEPSYFKPLNYDIPSSSANVIKEPEEQTQDYTIDVYAPRDVSKRMEAFINQLLPEYCSTRLLRSEQTNEEWDEISPNSTGSMIPQIASPDNNGRDMENSSTQQGDLESLPPRYASQPP